MTLYLFKSHIMQNIRYLAKVYQGEKLTLKNQDNNPKQVCPFKVGIEMKYSLPLSIYRCDGKPENNCQKLEHLHISLQKQGGMASKVKNGAQMINLNKLDEQFCQNVAQAHLDAFNTYIESIMFKREINGKTVEDKLEDLQKMVYKTVVFSIGDKMVKDIGLAAGYDAAYTDCVLGGSYDSCYKQLNEILGLDKNKAYKESYNLIYDQKSNSNRFSKLKAIVPDSFIQNYFGYYKYDLENVVKNAKLLEKTNYYCPFTTTKTEGESCQCTQNQQQDKLCRMIDGSVMISYDLAGQDQEQDNWLMGRKECNANNCDEFAKLVFEGVQNYLDQRNGVKIEDKNNYVVEKAPEDFDDNQVIDCDIDKRFEKQMIDRNKNTRNIVKRMRKKRMRMHHRKVW